MRECRICRDTECSNMVIIDESNGFLNLYNYCFGLAVTTQDVPRYLCKECAEKVTKFSCFKEECLKSEQLWKSEKTDPKTIYKNIKTEIDAENEESRDSYVSNGASFEISSYFNENNDEDSKPPHMEDPMKFTTDFIEEKGSNSDIEDDTANKKTDEKSNDKGKGRIIKQFKCRKCKKVYERQKWYLGHIKSCQRIINIKQRERLKSNKQYVQPTRTHNENVEKESDLRVQKETTIKSNVKKDDIYYCGLCEATFTSDYAISIHLDNHWKNQELDCKLCDFVAVDLAALIVHRFTHYPAKLKPRYNCHMCDKANRLHTASGLQFHYRSVHLKKIGGFCSKCNKEYKGLRSWKKHELKHKKTRDFICDICGRGFFFKYQIREHVMDHLDLNKYVCHECGKIFTRSKYLKIHMDGVHAKTGSVKCSHCNRIFKSSKTLRVHLSIVRRPKKLKCQYCPKEFSSACFLKDHMVMHSDARPYSCHICGVSYKAKSLLKVHIVTKHTGLKLHKCDLCAKSFGRPEQLKRHLSVHTGCRAHKCMQCDRSFHERKLLQKHYELRHKMADTN